MIYILTGNDIKKKNGFLKKLYKKDQSVFLLDIDTSKEAIFDYAGSLSLFGDSPVVVVESMLEKKEISFSAEDLTILKESKTMFIFLEGKLLAADSKKYQKYATIEDFNTVALKQVSKINVFGIADAFSRRDKIGAWFLYREAILAGVSPEEISGIIFWKIKTIILSGTKFFTTDELKIRSSNLLSVYHKAHRGECDFTIGLEQFILSSLSK